MSNSACPGIESRSQELEAGRLILNRLHKKNDCDQVGSVVEWLERRDCDRYGLGLKSAHAILLFLLKRHFTTLSPAWWSWQAVLNFSHISIKFQVDSNILASPEADGGNFLPYVLAPPSLSYESGG